VASAPRTRGLGQGLALLLGEQRGPAATSVQDLPLERIEPNPRQPRQHVDDQALAELATSIARDGVMQPVVVRPREGGWELIAGERRWRAARAAGLAHIPAVVREADDRQSLALALVENVLREDLNPVEQARAYARLADEFELSQTGVAEAVGRSRVSVANSLRLLELPDDVLALLERGALSEGHGRAILQVADHEGRSALGRAAVSGDLTVRETEAAARALGRPGRAKPRRRRGPAWYDLDLANDAVDAVYRSLGLPARVTSSGDTCRLEVTVRSSEELARLVDALDRLGDA
jgi:ParB family chromosome partitioning protein